MQGKANNIKEVIACLEEILEDSIAMESRLGYFAALYKRVTKKVEEGIVNGDFQDNEAMEKLDVVFANRYLTAYNNYQGGQETTQSWQVAFNAAKNRHPLVLQHLFVGMNAHISLDLGIAAYEVYGDNLKKNKADFDKINEILGALVDKVQLELESFWVVMKWLDRLAGKLDEELAGFAMDYARDKAWDFALKLLDAGKSTEEVTISKRDKSVARFGQKLVRPGFWLSIMVVVLKLFEKGSVASKIKKLNAK